MPDRIFMEFQDAALDIEINGVTMNPFDESNLFLIPMVYKQERYLNGTILSDERRIVTSKA